MKKNDFITKIINRPHVKDYTYTILFFCISSFFALFVIKPVLSIAFSLKREAEDLARVNDVYEKNVSKIIEIQSQLESVRDKMHLVDEALPESPQIKNLLNEIGALANQEGLQIKSITFSTLQLRPKEDKLDHILINIDVDSDFLKAQNLVKGILAQRRMKTIHTIKITRQSEIGKSPDTYLRIQMDVDAYYL